ncbi:MAG: HlyD family secretion protein, partial [Woeseia sp.]
PQVAVTRDAKGDASAMVVTDEGTVERRDISVSRTVGDDWLVSDGLADGERVVVAGLQKIRPGIQVNVTDSATINDDAPASERSATGTPKSAEDPRQ